MFGNREEVLSGPRGQSQSRRLLKEKKKSKLLFTESRNVSASLGNKGDEREHGSCRKSPKTVCPKGTKYCIIWRKTISYFLWCMRRRGMG